MKRPKSCCDRTPWYDTIIGLKHNQACYSVVRCLLCKRIVYSNKSMSQAISNWNRKR